MTPLEKPVKRVTVQLTQDDALAFYESGKWEAMTFAERAQVQLHQNRLCMPFDTFHEAVEKTLGRPVWTHEFHLNREGLQRELADLIPAPSFERIIGMLPADKIIVVVKP